MRLEEFLEKDWVRNAYLDELEWEHIYVRRGITACRVLETDEPLVIEDIFVLANIQARVPRTGAFTRFVERIEKAAPGLPLMVENLTDFEFGKKLEERGFEEVYIGEKPFSAIASRHFILRPLERREIVFPFRRLTLSPDEETMRLARRVAAQRFDPWKLPPKKLKEWLNRVSKDLANAGEAEYGPAYRKKS